MAIGCVTLVLAGVLRCICKDTKLQITSYSQNARIRGKYIDGNHEEQVYSS